MAQLRALVKRRKAVRNIRKITRTMELIATARFQKAMQRAMEASAFTKKIAELAADLSANAGNITHPLLVQRTPAKNAVLLVICSNRGLCGGYNASILRNGIAHLRELKNQGLNLRLEVSGKRALAFFKFQGYSPDEAYTQFEDKPKFEEVEPIATKYIEGYIQGEFDRVDVAYMKFLNAGKQAPAVETLLPLAAPEAKVEKAVKGAVEYEFLPSAKDILEELLPISFKTRLFKCFLDAAVSEQIARRVAMKAATENAGDMIKSLTLQYNRARQAQITKEISEVIGGAAALE